MDDKRLKNGLRDLDSWGTPVRKTRAVKPCDIEFKHRYVPVGPTRVVEALLGGDSEFYSDHLVYATEHKVRCTKCGETAWMTGRIQWSGPGAEVP